MADQKTNQDDLPDWREGIDMEVMYWKFEGKFFVVCEGCDDEDSPDFPELDELFDWIRNNPGGVVDSKWLCQKCLEEIGD